MTIATSSNPLQHQATPSSYSRVSLNDAEPATVPVSTQAVTFSNDVPALHHIDSPQLHINQHHRGFSPAIDSGLPTRVPSPTPYDNENGSSKEKEFVEPQPSIDVEELFPAPDGGIGWLVVFFCFVVQAVSIGQTQVYGIYQQHYLDVAFKGSSTSSQLALVGTLVTVGIDVFGIGTGIMADRFGYQLIIRIGSVLLTASLIAASFATQLWQLYLSQGLLFGIGCGMIFLPTLSLPSQYFTTKRGVATGITAAGTGVGGLILSPITNALIQAIGFRWALRITAIITFVVVNIGTFFLKTRIVPRGGGGKLFDTEVLRDKRFYTLTVLVVFWSMGVMLPFFYLPTYAATAGLTTAQAATIVSVTNAFSAIGRVVNGYVADRLGRVNLLAVGTVIAGLSVLVIWLPAGSSFGVLIAFGIVFGFFSGGVIGLVPVVTSMIFGAERLASILGMVYLGWAVGTMTGNQVAGKIIDSVGRDGAHSFYGIIVLAGVSVFLGGMCGFVLRRMMTKKWRLII